MKYEMITLSMVKHYGKKIYHIKATQKYMPEFNIGHWQYYITNHNGDIVYMESSCCGAPVGKINQEFLQKVLKRFYREYKERVRIEKIVYD